MHLTVGYLATPTGGARDGMFGGHVIGSVAGALAPERRTFLTA